MNNTYIEEQDQIIGNLNTREVTHYTSLLYSRFWTANDPDGVLNY